MYKKAQVTVFIILGIIIIIILGFVLYLKFYPQIYSLFKTETEKPALTSSTAKLVFEEIENCVNQEVLYSISYLYNHGGYYNVPVERALQLTPAPFTSDFLPYYYVGNKKFVPDLNTVSKELYKAIMENVVFCSELESIKFYGIKIGNISNITISFNKGIIDVYLIYPFSLDKNNLNFEKVDFKIIIKSNIPEILFFSDKVVDEYSKKPGYLCLNCLRSLNNQTEISLNIIDGRETFYYSDDLLWFLINEKNNNLPINLTWIFIVENKYEQ